MQSSPGQRSRRHRQWASLRRRHGGSRSARSHSTGDASTERGLGRPATPGDQDGSGAGAAPPQQAAPLPAGEVENRGQEPKPAKQLDRTSCSWFRANQFRLLLAAARYALQQEFRWQPRKMQFARMQVGRLRLCPLKLAVRSQPTVLPIVVLWPAGSSVRRSGSGRRRISVGHRPDAAQARS